MKVLIYGGCGYLGCNISSLLANSDYQVTVVDNFMYKQQASVFNLFKHQNIQFIYHDVLDYEKSNELAKGFDVVIPLAAIVGANACDKDPSLAIATNLTFIQKLTDSLNENQLLLFFDSNSAYGSSNELVTELSPFKPLSLYGKTKAEAEEYVLKHHKKSIALRLATVFGNSGSGRLRLDLLVNNLTYKAYFEKKLKIFEPHYRRNFIHVNDIARCVLFCIQNQNKMVGECYNVGLDSANMTKGQLVEKIAKIIGCEIEICAGEDFDKRDYLVSSAKLANVGFTAETTLEEGIESLIPFFSSMQNLSENERNDITKSMFNYEV